MSEKNTAVQPNEKLWNKTFLMLLILSTFLQSASQMVTPLISKYAISMGAQLSIAASISSLMSVTALILRPVSGLFSDKYNRKHIILISNGCVAACMILMASVKSVPMLVAVRLLHGIAFSFNSVALMAFNTLFIPKSRLGEGMGWMALGTIVSQALGPNLGIILVDHGGFGVCFVTAAAICVAGIIIIAFMPYHFKPAVSTINRFDINNMVSLRILPYAAILCLFSIGNGCVSSLLILFGEDRGIANIGMFFTAYSITMIAIRPFAGKLVDRKGLEVVLYPSMAIFAFAFVILGNASVPWMIVIAAVMKAVGQGTGGPGIQSTCLAQIGREKAGVVSSTCFIGQDLGNILGPIIGGFVAENAGYRFLFNGYAVVMFVLGCAIFNLKQKYDAKKYGI